MLDEIAALLGVKKGVLMAGFFGAMLSAFIGPPRGRVEKIITFCVGFAFAVYITGPVVGYFNLNNGNYDGGIGFVLGLFGMTMTDSIYKTFQDVKWAELWTSIIKKLTGTN